jgi:hypothetical protein
MRRPRLWATVDGRRDECGGAGVLDHREDEGPVELELVDRQVAQVAQGAVAGAEAVLSQIAAAPEAATRQ